MNTRHSAVLLGEITHWLQPDVDNKHRYCLLLDGTLGGGGHSEALLQSNEAFFILGIDRDKRAIERCSERLKRFENRVYLCQGNFARIQELIHAIPEAVVRTVSGPGKSSYPLFDRILVDLGISSDQLDDRLRGFSFMEDAPLDMRMNQDDSKTAADILNSYSPRDLERMFFRGGVERSLSRSLARAVISRRPIERTLQFAELCRELSPEWLRKRKGLRAQHPATLPFQALRIEVNEELSILSEFLSEAIQCLAPGGRLAVISFHSGEDKLVTAKMRQWSRTAVLPRNIAGLPPPAPGRLLTRKPILPSLSEVEANARARSARLRVFEKSNNEFIGAV